MNTTVIGERLLQRRKELNLTLEDIAKRVGVTKSTIQRYEVGKISSPKIAVLKSIAYALETSYSWLIGETENHLPDNLYLSSPSNKQGVPIPVLGRVSASLRRTRLKGIFLKNRHTLTRASSTPICASSATACIRNLRTVTLC